MACLPVVLNPTYFLKGIEISLFHFLKRATADF